MELLRQAITIMVLGMTLVFAFLALVILAMSLAARLIRRWEGAPPEETGDRADPASAGGRRAAAIAAALARFRECRNPQ